MLLLILATLATVAAAAAGSGAAVRPQDQTWEDDGKCEQQGGSVDTKVCSRHFPGRHIKFLEWLEDGGAILHPSVKIRASSATGIRGLNTDVDLAADEELAVVPRTLWLDERAAMLSKVGPLLAEIKSQTKDMVRACLSSTAYQLCGC